MKQSSVAIYPGQHRYKGSRIPSGPIKGPARPNRIAIGQRLVFRGPFGQKEITVSLFSNSFPEGKIPYHLCYDGVVSSSVVLSTERAEITLAGRMGHHKSGGTFILSIQVGDDKPLELEYHLTYKNYEARLTKSQKQAMESHLVYDPAKGTFKRVVADNEGATTLFTRLLYNKQKTYLCNVVCTSTSPIFGEQQTKKRPLQDNGSKGWVTRIIENPSGISLPPLKKLDSQPIKLTNT